MSDVFTSKWKGDEFLGKLQSEWCKNLKRACIHVANQTKKNISEPPPASAPEQFPHREDGELRRSVTWEVDEKAAKGRVGTNKIYGRYLELGTDQMEPRPFLRPTLAQERNTVRRILGGKTDVKG